MIVSFAISVIGLLMLLVNCILFNKTAKDKDAPYKILRIYLTLLFIVELGCHIIGFLHPNTNFFLSHYYFIFQFIFLSLFFYNLFSNKHLKKFVVAMLVVVLLGLAFQYYRTPGLYWRFNIEEIAATTLLLILYTAIFLTKYHEKYFYFCFGLLSYLSCSCFIFISGNTDLVLFKEPFLLDIWIFNSLLYIFYQSMIYKEWKMLNKK